MHAAPCEHAPVAEFEVEGTVAGEVQADFRTVRQKEDGFVRRVKGQRIHPPEAGFHRCQDGCGFTVDDGIFVAEVDHTGIAGLLFLRGLSQRHCNACSARGNQDGHSDQKPHLRLPFQA